ncbi:MAG: TetR/AcrR family transcriptional regulator [Sphaerochaetaceae bacterium]
METCTKDKIILAFLSQASKEGLNNASLQKTADLVNIKKASIYSHFSNREDLVNQMFDYCQAKIKKESKKITLSQKDPKEELSSLAFWFFDLFQEKEMKEYFRILQSSKLFNLQSQTNEKKLKYMLTSRSEVYVDFFVQTGQLKIKNSEFAAELFSSSLLLLLENLFIQKESFENSKKIDWEIQSFVEKFVDLFSN